VLSLIWAASSSSFSACSHRHLFSCLANHPPLIVNHSLQCIHLSLPLTEVAITMYKGSRGWLGRKVAKSLVHHSLHQYRSCLSYTSEIYIERYILYLGNKIYHYSSIRVKSPINRVCKGQCKGACKTKGLARYFPLF